MAEAIFNASVDPAKALGVSAGTAPGNQVHPEVHRVLMVDVPRCTGKLYAAQLFKCG